MNGIAIVGMALLSIALIGVDPAIAQDEIRVVDYGANCDDHNVDIPLEGRATDDDTDALLAATEALWTTGARVLSLRGCKSLTLSEPWLLQWGEHNGIEIVGDWAGVGNDLFDIPGFGLNYFIQQGGSRIYWKGAVGGNMLTVQGPINGLEIRGIQFDAGFRAGTAIEVQQCWACKFSQLSIVNYTGTAIISTTRSGLPTSSPEAPVPHVSHGTGVNIWEQILVAAPFGNNTTSGILLTGDTSTAFNTTWTTVRDSLFVYGGGVGTSGIELEYADNITIENVYTVPKEEEWNAGGNSLKFTRQIGSGCGGACDQFPKENSIYKFMGHQPIGGTHGLGGGGSVILPLSLDDSVDATGTPRVLPVEPIENLRILTNRGDFYGPFAFEQLTVGDLPNSSHSDDLAVIRRDIDAIVMLRTIDDGDVKLKLRLDGENEYVWTVRRDVGPFNFGGSLDLTDLSVDPYGHPTKYIRIDPGGRAVRLFDTVEGDGLAQFTFLEDGRTRMRGLNFTALIAADLIGLPEFTWCSDCGVAPTGECQAGGPGRWAFSNGATWQCPF